LREKERITRMKLVIVQNLVERDDA